MSKILVIPDAHQNPKSDLNRWKILNKLIIKEDPDHIVCLGDLFDFESLSYYDKGKKGFEERRYQDDIDCVQALLPNISYRRANLVFLTGNHEFRYDRLLRDEPRLEGALNSPYYLMEKYGWKVYDFLKTCTIEDIYFSHYYVSGDTFKAIGGVNAARSILLSTFRSTVSGHSHRFDYHVDKSIDGSLYHTLVAGHFNDPKQQFDYARQDSWFKSGVTILHNAKKGEYDLEFISLDRMVKEYK